MPDLGYYHPIVVHFAVALLAVGVLFRLLAFVRRLSWLSPAAFVLILLGTGAAVGAVKSGDDAHGPVERIPGARTAVHEHEEWGERARNAFLAVLALEVAALFLARRKKEKLVLVFSALAGLGGVFALFEAAEHGGELVYGYAGGVGVRSGDPQDVGRLFLAGLHQQAQIERREGRLEQAAKLYKLMSETFPDDLDVSLAYAFSLVSDAKDPAAALATLDALKLPAEDGRLQIQAGMIRAEALQAQGDLEAARKVLQALLEKFPENRRLKRSLEDLR